MSLRIFHICFIMFSTLMSAGLSWWCFETNAALFWCYLFAVIASALPPYGVWFFFKSRRLVHGDLR